MFSKILVGYTAGGRGIDALALSHSLSPANRLAAIVPLSTAYSASEACGRKADIDDSFAEARVFYLSYGAVVAFAAIPVLIPGTPPIPILFLS